MKDAIIDNAVDTSVSDTGDFGEGVATLEEQLLNSIPKEDEVNEPEEPTISDDAPKAVEEVKVSAPVESVKPTEQTKLFDINGKLSLKEGAPLTSEHIKELERGWLREADYTRKTQEVAKIRNEAQQILNNQAKIQEDVRNIFEFIPPEKLLSAFTRQEMLSHGLHAGGVSPQAWNQFLEWRKENGEESADKPTPSADPYAQQFETFARKLEAIERRDQTREQAIKAQEQEAAYKNQMAAYESEVNSAIAEFPAVNKRQLLVEMASSDGSKTIKELAQDLSNSLESRFQEYLKTKTAQKQTTIKAPKGTSVPIVKKMPKTFDEVEEHVAGLMGFGAG